MRGIIHISIWLVLSLLVSCTGTLTGGNGDVKQIDLTDISFDKYLKLSDFAESVEAIPLETTDESLIDNVKNIYLHDNCYYMVCTEGISNPRLMVFDASGKFLSKLHRIGEGPGEYVEMIDCFPLPDGSIKVIGWNKIVNYDKDLNYVNETAVSMDMRDAVGLSDGSYIISCEDYKDKNNRILYSLSGKDELLQPFLPLNGIDHTKVRTHQLVNYFSKCNGNLYFNYALCDTIYHIENSSAIPQYYVDFGKYKVDFSGVSKRDVEVSRLDKKINAKEYMTMWYFQVASDYLVLGLGYLNQPPEHSFKTSLCLYSFKTGKVLNGTGIIDDMHLVGNKMKFKFMNLPHIVIDDYLYAPVSPATIMDGCKNLRNKLGPKKWERFKYSHPRLMALCDGLHEDDNPVLLKIKLKKPE